MVHGSSLDDVLFVLGRLRLEDPGWPLLPPGHPGHLLFGFEVKRPEVGRLSKIQEQTIKEINAAGGTTAVVSYPEQVERIILSAEID